MRKNLENTKDAEDADWVDKVAESFNGSNNRKKTGKNSFGYKLSSYGGHTNDRLENRSGLFYRTKPRTTS